MSDLPGAPSRSAQNSGFSVPMDEERLQILREVAGEEMVADLVSRFGEDLKVAMVRLRAALERQDWDTLATAAHALKGSSANLGAMTVANHCSELEVGARRGEFEALGPALAALQSAAEAVWAYLSAGNNDR